MPRHQVKLLKCVRITYRTGPVWRGKKEGLLPSNPDTRTPFLTDKTLFCQGRESNRPLGCSTVLDTALDMVEVTDLTLVRSPDR